MKVYVVLEPYACEQIKLVTTNLKFAEHVVTEFMEMGKILEIQEHEVIE